MWRRGAASREFLWKSLLLEHKTRVLQPHRRVVLFLWNGSDSPLQEQNQEIRNCRGYTKQCRSWQSRLPHSLNKKMFNVRIHVFVHLKLVWFFWITFSPAALDRPTGFPLESNTWIPVSASSLLIVSTLKKARAAGDSQDTCLWKVILLNYWLTTKPNGKINTVMWPWGESIMDFKNLLANIEVFWFIRPWESTWEWDRYYRPEESLDGCTSHTESFDENLRKGLEQKIKRLPEKYFNF